MITCRPTKHSVDGLYDFIFHIQKFYDTKELTLLEVGSWKGESVRIFADYFKTVVCIDPWDVDNAPEPMKPDVEIAEAMINKLVREKKNIIKIKGTSVEVAKNMIDKFDVIYIDALHEYNDVMNDIIAWNDKALKFIGGHDYRVNTNGVILAVNEIFKKPDRTFKDWSWIVRKNA